MKPPAGYAVLGILGAVVTQISYELGAGNVPIPPEWRWLAPILVAGLTALGALLPSLRGQSRRVPHG